MKKQVILKMILVIAVMFGIVFRFVALDKKAYWFDETFTSLRVSGFTDSEAVDTYRATTNVATVGELRKFQLPQPDRGVGYTVRGLALEEPQNPPLYFAAAKLWADAFGGSVYSMRLFPTLLSLFVLPCVYWLCLELFESQLIGWIAVSLMSISPFYILLAQTARPQSLWTATIIFSSAALLRAIRKGSYSSWVLYSVILIINLYTFVLSGLFIVGFGLYVLILERFRLTKTVVACAISSSVAALAFVPWAIILYTSRSNVAATTHWTDSKLTFLELFRAWGMGLTRLFFDINNQSDDSVVQLLPLLIVMPLLLTLFSYSAFCLHRDSRRRSWIFIFLLMGSTLLPLVLADLLRGGGRLSAAHRYLIPGYVGIQLTISFLLGQKLSTECNPRRQTAWQFLTFLVIFLGLASSAASSRAESWWNKDPDGSNREIARIVNRSNAPLVISDGWMGHLFSVASYLNDTVKLRIEPLCYVCTSAPVRQPFPIITSGFTDVFYFHPGWEPGAFTDLQKLSELGILQPVVSQHNRVVLWKLAKVQ
jgi:uncharacterized membrane protein